MLSAKFLGSTSPKKRRLQVFALTSHIFSVRSRGKTRPTRLQPRHRPKCSAFNAVFSCPRIWMQELAKQLGRMDNFRKGWILDHWSPHVAPRTRFARSPETDVNCRWALKAPSYQNNQLRICFSNLCRNAYHFPTLTWQVQRCNPTKKRVVHQQRSRWFWLEHWQGTPSPSSSLFFFGLDMGDGYVFDFFALQESKKKSHRFTLFHH